MVLCSAPKCFQTRKKRCMKPNAWIVHLQKNAGMGLNRQQLSETYRESKLNNFHRQDFCHHIYLTRARSGLVEVSNDIKKLSRRLVTDAKKDVQEFVKRASRGELSAWNWAENNFGKHIRNVYRDFTVSILREKVLSHRGWLDDMVINYIGESFAKEYDNVGYLTTFFINSILQNPNRKWLKGFVWKDCKYLFIPHHMNGNHWTLFVVFVDKHRIEYFDSLGNSAPFGLASKILTYLVSQKDFDYNPAMWSLYSYGKESPQQTNFSDCGMFVLETMSQIILGEPVMNRNMKEVRTLLGRRLIGKQ